MSCVVDVFMLQQLERSAANVWEHFGEIPGRRFAVIGVSNGGEVCVITYVWIV